jgi:hypothetical protein
VFIRPVHINGSLDPLVEAASIAAFDAADDARQTVVFAPPICTFRNPEHARTADLANGVCLSVEIDDGDTFAACRRLEGILGAATVVVESGGEIVDPQTGEILPKLHIHLRLSEPTRTRSYDWPGTWRPGW